MALLLIPEKNEIIWRFELEVCTATYGPEIDQSQRAKSVSHIVITIMFNWRKFQEYLMLESSNIWEHSTWVYLMLVAF